MQCPAFTDPMLWTVQSRPFLFSNELWPAISKFASSNLRKHRYLSTANPEEQTPPQETSWLEEDSQHEDNVAQPQGATASPISSPEMSIGRGVEIDKRGQIRVVSRARAEKPCRTILIIPAASTSLTRADFTRLLPEKNRTDSTAMGCMFVTSFT